METKISTNDIKIQQENEPTTFKGLLTDFANNTTLHGLPRVITSAQLIRKFVWFCIFFGSFGYFSFQVAELINDYYKWPVLIRSEMKLRTFMEVPAVTICNMNMLRRSKIEGTMFNSLVELDNDTANEIIEKQDTTENEINNQNQIQNSDKTSRKKRNINMIQKSIQRPMSKENNALKGHENKFEISRVKTKSMESVNNILAFEHEGSGSTKIEHTFFDGSLPENEADDPHSLNDEYIALEDGHSVEPIDDTNDNGRRVRREVAGGSGGEATDSYVSDPTDTTTDSYDTYTDPTDTTTDSYDTNTDPTDTTTDSYDTNTDPTDTTTDSFDTNTNPTDTTIDSYDTNTDPTDTTTDSYDTNTDPTDTTTDSYDTNTDPTDTIEDSFDTNTDPVSTNTYPIYTDSYPTDPNADPMDFDTYPTESYTDPNFQSSDYYESYEYSEYESSEQEMDQESGEDPGYDVPFQFEQSKLMGIKDPNNYAEILRLAEAEDLSDIFGLASPTVEQLDEYGHNLSDLVALCTFDGENCNRSSDHWLETYNKYYGKCYTWNSVINKPRGERPLVTTNFGSRYGLRLTLNVERDEYTGLFSPTYGTRVAIHDSSIISYPENDGITASVGNEMVIRLRLKKYERETEPYPSDCVKDDDLVKQFGGYTVIGCMRECLEERLVKRCKCLDRIVEKDEHRCSYFNRTEELCRQRVYYAYNSGKLGCKCRARCRENKYDISTTVSTWPSKHHDYYLLNRLKERGIQTLEEIEDNILRVHIYFEDFNVETIKEVPAYSVISLLSNIGGTMGMFVGLSICTLGEFLELIWEMIMLLRRKISRRHNMVNASSA
ncbi:unnamed protein product [Owenia fusiformis]|uniref:Uncharacterized protein n=1 Tax=Owenia fusiformis TaxID=6347 RepID=A0A8J1UBK3_OWEFU|nr:unnamed protein product [Owenia fusiformis]